MVVATLIPQATAECSEVGVVRDDHAALAGGQLLVAVEGEDAHVADRANLATTIVGGNGFAGVFNDMEVELTGELEERLHVAGETENVDWENGADSGTRAEVGGNARVAVEGTERMEKLANLMGVEIQSDRVNIGEDRPSTLEECTIRRGDKAERAGEDLVSGTDAEATNSKVQGGSAAADGNCVPRAGKSSELFFKFRHARTEAKLTGAKHAGDVFDFETGDVRAGQWNPHGCAPSTAASVGCKLTWSDTGG